MSQYGKTGEESMEEILASIRSSVDTPETTQAAQTTPPPEPGIGAAHAGRPSIPPQNGSGRLQDALLSVAPADNRPSAKTDAPSAPSNTGLKAPPAPNPMSAAPLRSNGSSLAGDTQPVGADDLSDLFADPTPPTMPTKVAAPSETAEKISAATFGMAPKPSDAGTPEQSGSPLSSEGAAALVKPESVRPASPDVPKAPAAPEVIASMPTQTPASEAAPAPADIDPKPKREPSFAALKTLASGPSPAKASQSDSAEGSAKSSVLLPEMRDLPGTNPVAQMQSMAVNSSPAKSGGFMPAAATTPDAPTEPPTQADLDASAEEHASQTSPPVAVAGIAPGARVEATASSRSLEDIVVDLLKPQLSQWLEANMPRIVERALRAEQSGSSDKENS